MNISKLMPLVEKEFERQVRTYVFTESEVDTIMHMLGESERITLRKLLDEEKK